MGHVYLMLCNAASLLKELKVLLASTSKCASVFPGWNVALIKCIVASIPAIWPEHSWREPAASWISPLAMDRMAFDVDVILLAHSQIPMGLTPGNLSNAIKQHVRKADSPMGSARETQSLLVSRTREWHSCQEAEWKEVQRCLQQCASRPEGPAAPLVLKAA